MSVAADDLIAFWTARLDEVEAEAREACDGDSGRWFMGDRWDVYRAEDEARYDWDDQGDEHRLVVYGNVKPQSEHIARHDPARVLRDVEADRKLLDLHARAKSYRDQVFARPEPRSISDEMRAVTQMMALEQVAKIRVVIWSDHPDYRQEWKPNA